MASAQGHIDVVRLLLDNRAQINIRNNNNRTALYWANQSANTEVLELLKASGAKEWDLPRTFPPWLLVHSTTRQLNHIPIEWSWPRDKDNFFRHSAVPANGFEWLGSSLWKAEVVEVLALELNVNNTREGLLFQDFVIYTFVLTFHQLSDVGYHQWPRFSISTISNQGVVLILPWQRGMRWRKLDHCLRWRTLSLVRIGMTWWRATISGNHIP